MTQSFTRRFNWCGVNGRPPRPGNKKSLAFLPEWVIHFSSAFAVIADRPDRTGGPPLFCETSIIERIEPFRRCTSRTCSSSRSRACNMVSIAVEKSGQKYNLLSRYENLTLEV